MRFFRFRHLSIKAQLILAVMLATAVASVVAAGLSIWREVGSYAEAKRLEALATAGLFASAAADAIAEGDSDRAHDVLRAMRSMPSVIYVRFANASGETIAEHGFGGRLVRQDEPAAGALPSFRDLASGHPFLIEEPVLRGGLRVGAVELLISTDDLRRRLAGLVTNAGYATALALLLGILAAQFFRRRIAARIDAVTSAMRAVQATHSYDTTLANGRQDEFGVLIDSFNGMMREIKTRDRKLAEHRANLEGEVRHRTRDLVVAKQAADDANAAKSQFLATMSHEIRTPLNGLMVMAELLAAADLESRERRYADVIVRSGGTLLAIINDILDFSKIEAGKIDLEAIPLDLADVVDDVCQLFASKAAGQGLDLAAYIDPALGAVVGDPVRIGQIVSNLVNNAIKFTEKGHVSVEVVADPLRPGHVLFSVSDTGIGIAQDKLQTVFESFSQADQSTTRKFGGTGLGLSICQRLVRVMEGQIGVESTQGTGSRFWFSVPMAMADSESSAVFAPFFQMGVQGATALCLSRYAAAGMAGPEPLAPVVRIVDPQSAADTSDVPAATVRTIVLARMGDGAASAWITDGRAVAAIAWPIRRRELSNVVAEVAAGRSIERMGLRGRSEQARYPNARVLVVDDGPVNREVATEALRRFGITPETAADGAEAHRLAASGGYDLILMDGSMPVMDGFEASRAIRADETRLGHRRQPIVALTAHAIGEAAEAWKAADMDGLLLKPFNLAQIGACLARHLTGQAAGPESHDLAHVPAASQSGGKEAAMDDGLLNPETMATLELLAAADREPVRRIVHLFVEHSRPAFERIRVAATDASAGDLASAIHAFKSMAMSVGALALSDLLAHMEKSARLRSFRPSETDLAQIDGLLTRSVTALNALPWMQDRDGASLPGSGADGITVAA